MITKNNNYIKLDGLNSSLVLVKKDNRLGLAHFGKKIKGNNFDFVSYFGDEYHSPVEETSFLHSVFSATGDGNIREPLVIINDENGNFIHRFKFVDSVVMDADYSKIFPSSRDKEGTVKLTFKSLSNELFVNVYISCFADSSVYAFKTEVVNKTGRPITVQRLMSLQLDFWGESAEVVSFDGAWARERTKHVSKLNAGIFSVETKQGFSSAEHNPFVMLKLKSDDIVASNLIWSGNHKQIVEISQMNYVRYFTGINDHNFSYLLNDGESLESPEAIACRASSEQEITGIMHDFVMNHIVPERFRKMERPVLLNNWEATYMDFNAEKILSLAKKAKELGVELFVLDDGWFGKRDVDNCSLGDWVDYKEKTGGLRKLRDNIKAMGLKFGLWFEPEMANPDSDLFRAHPEFIQFVPGLDPLRRREQYVLDFANKECRDYVVNIINKVIDEVQMDYIKWDCNRCMTDVNSVALKNQGDYYYEYMRGLYDVFRRLVEAHPEILFEGCSSGGNRFDLGVVYYMPQTWCSDNTDAGDRVFIQEGTLYAYPQSTIGAHVSVCPNHQTGNATSLESRFNVACVGAFGYEMDITKCTKEEQDVIKEQIEFYKKHRNLLQFGKYYRLGDVFSGNKSGWIIVSKDKSEAMVMLLAVHKQTNGTLEGVKLCGLDDDAEYLVEMRKQNNCNAVESFTAFGDTLNNAVINFGDIYSDFDKNQNHNSISTRMFYLKKIQ